MSCRHRRDRKILPKRIHQGITGESLYSLPVVNTAGWSSTDIVKLNNIKKQHNDFLASFNNMNYVHSTFHANNLKLVTLDHSITELRLLHQKDMVGYSSFSAIVKAYYRSKINLELALRQNQ